MSIRQGGIRRGGAAGGSAIRSKGTRSLSRGQSTSSPSVPAPSSSSATEPVLRACHMATMRSAKCAGLPSSVRLSVGLDSREALAGLSAAARKAGRTVGVLVELDLGMRRVGVQLPADAIALARAIGMTEAVEYRGITFYPGHVRAPVGEQGTLGDGDSTVA